MTDATMMLATIIKNAAKIREDSWVECKDLSQSYYTKDMGQAAKEASTAVGELDLWYPVMLALESNWNDILTWAEDPEHLDIEFDPEDGEDHKDEWGSKLICV